MTSALGAAYAGLDPRSRYAITDYAERFPNCLAAAVGAAMEQGVSARDVEALIATLSPVRRGLLYLDAARQHRTATHRGASSRADFYGALSALADRKNRLPQL